MEEPHKIDVAGHTIRLISAGYGYGPDEYVVSVRSHIEKRGIYGDIFPSFRSAVRMFGHMLAAIATESEGEDGK